MTKIKTSELEGAALDWAAMKSEGWDEATLDALKRCATLGRNFVTPSTKWQWGGGIVSNLVSRGFQIVPEPDGGVSVSNFDCQGAPYGRWEDSHIFEIGPTILIACCRARVAADLGDEVEVPDSLMQP